MRLPALETEVSIGTKNPVQFYLTGSNSNSYQIRFGLNLPGSTSLSFNLLHQILKVIEKSKQIEKISVSVRQLGKL
jgi:hypothetical protein